VDSVDSVDNDAQESAENDLVESESLNHDQNREMNQEPDQKMAEHNIAASEKAARESSTDAGEDLRTPTVGGPDASGFRFIKGAPLG
jgi:biotin carboxyl carrier protein